MKTRNKNPVSTGLFDLHVPMIYGWFGLSAQAADEFTYRRNAFLVQNTDGL
jgi:hypothetical protein